MRKLIRNILLVILLVSFLVIPAYSEASVLEASVIIIPVGAPNYAVRFFQILIDSYSKIEADWLRDLNIRYDQYSPIYPSTFVDWKEIEMGNYKTALFLFGELSLDPSVMLTDVIDIDHLIEELKKQILFCQQKGINVIGIPFYIETEGFSKFLVYWDLDYNNKVIKELVPLMNEIWIVYDFDDCNNLNTNFIKIAEENNIYIDHLRGSSNRVLRDSFKIISSELESRIR